MAHCRVLLCNLNKKSASQGGNFLFISNKHLVTFHFPLAIYREKLLLIPDLFHIQMTAHSPDCDHAECHT